MNISSTQIHSILQNHDNQSSYLSYYVLSDYEDVAKLRDFCKTLPVKDTLLTKQEILAFITILLESSQIGKEPHDTLFVTLKDLIDKEKLQAFARLHAKKILTESSITAVEKHSNPKSMARMFTHLLKPCASVEIILKESEYKLKSDPYFEVKSITSREKGLHILASASINDESINSLANQTIVMNNPIIMAKMLKKLLCNNVPVTNENFLLCNRHENPLNMALALIQVLNNNLPDKNEILHIASAHSDPNGFVGGVIILEKNKINTPENRRLIAQYQLPEISAKIISLKKIKKNIEQTGYFTHAILRGLILFKGSTLNPNELVDNEINKLKEQLSNSL